jgi:tRNA threonylcarbamoyladenosine modification (KEOPS) complex  Pcc1 subunit
VKLSMSNPRASRAALACSGTNRLFNSGAIESSILISHESLMYSRSTYRDARSRIGLADHGRDCWGDVSLAIECWDHAIHRRMGDTWLRLLEVAVWVCILEGRR